MASFLVDEDLPRSLGRRLRDAGLIADDVRDVGLGGRPDDEVFAYAVANAHTLITGDLGFANIVKFPLGSHSGIVLTRFPNTVPAATLEERVVRALRLLALEDFTRILVVIGPRRVRVRRPG